MVNQLQEAIDFVNTVVTSNSTERADIFGVDTSDYESLSQEGYPVSQEQSEQCDMILQVKSSLDKTGLPKETISRWFRSMPKRLQEEETTPLELLTEFCKESSELLLTALPEDK